MQQQLRQRQIQLTQQQTQLKVQHNKTSMPLHAMSQIATIAAYIAHSLAVTSSIARRLATALTIRLRRTQIRRNFHVQTPSLRTKLTNV